MYLPIGRLRCPWYSEIFHGRTSVGLPRDYGTRGEEEAVERHWLQAELLDSSVTSEVRSKIVRTTKSWTDNEIDIAVLMDGAVYQKDRLVEVLAQVMTTSTTASPL